MPTTSEVPTTQGMKRAALYLRVSTPSQVNNDFNPEGISIPAQRVAALQKADAMGVTVPEDAVYVEPGRTATEIEKRPVYLEMVARIRQRRDIDFVIVYQFSRIFRNALEAAIAKNELRKLGVRVVSTNLDLGDTLEAQMVETIIHAVDEYQVKASAADIKYKMHQKVKNGGTPSRAKLGYRNVQIDVDGRPVRTIALDEQRAPLIDKAFEWMETGRFTLESLLARVTEAGLTARADRRHPKRPISLETLRRILRDRYYTGRIEVDGEWIEARHDRIVSDERFDRVQAILDSHSGSGVRERRHDHYLKGHLRCNRSGHRLLVLRSEGNGGVYFYFFCRGRQLKECDLPYLLVEDVERAVEQHYATVRLAPELVALVRERFTAALDDEFAAMDMIKNTLEGRLAQIEQQEDAYLALVGNPNWPQVKLEAKVVALRTEREQIAADLAKTSGDLSIGRELFALALRYLDDPQTLYRSLGPAGRRLLTNAVFGHLEFDLEPEGVRVVSSDVREPFRGLLAAQERIRGVEGGVRAYGRVSSDLSHDELIRALWPEESSRGSLLAETAPAWDTWAEEDLLPVGLSAHGWSKPAMVEVRGFEPLTPCLPSKCSTS